jgi:hypothetical protein
VGRGAGSWEDGDVSKFLRPSGDGERAERFLMQPIPGSTQVAC